MQDPSALRRAGLLLTLALLIVGTLVAPTAHAGTINVWACHAPDGQTAAPMDRWSSYINAPFINASNTCASNGAGAFGLDVAATSHPGHTYGTWMFQAPPNTSVTQLLWNRTWSVWGWASWQVFRGTQPIFDSPHLAELCQAASGCHTAGWQTVGTTMSNEAGVLMMLESCALAGGCDSASNGTALIHSARVTLEDSSAPTFSALSGALASGNALRGNASLSFQANDAGTGLYRIHATVDGRSFDDRVIDSNGGKCVPIAPWPRDYMYAVPCPLGLSVSTRLNTATLPDGTHSILVRVEDAAGNLTTVFTDDVETANAPVLAERPEVTGTTKLGVQVTSTTGVWSPTPTSYAYRWLRCPASATLPSDVDACTTIAGATSATYSPVTADVYWRVMVRVTASNAAGSTSAVSAPSAIVADNEGRTSPPVPSDGGSRDVVVVPLPPGGGSSSSSSTTIINPPAGSSPIEGLKNPIAGPGHVPNGTNASEGGRVKIWFTIKVRGKRKRVSSVRTLRHQTRAIDGQLVNAANQAIGGGKLVTAWQTQGRWVAHTGAVTRADGRFRYILPAGASRRVKFIYFAHSDSPSWAESNVVSVKVKTPVKLSVEPRTARNKGEPVEFTGSVPSDYLPRRGILVRLQGRAPGDRWKPVKTAHTKPNGRFVIRYGFKRTTVETLFEFRVIADEQAGYPYAGGASRTVTVLVRP